MEMATVAFHTLHSTQTVVLTEPKSTTARPIRPVSIRSRSTGVTGPASTARILRGPAREQAWTGTAHALIASRASAR